MSQENVELVRGALNAWVEVDEGLADPQSRLGEFFAPDAITSFSGFLQEGTTLRGIDEFLRFRAAWMEPYDDWSYEAEKILAAAGNRVVVTLHQRGKPHDSDSWVEMRYGLVYTVEEGLISRVRFYATPEEALEAAGLREEETSQEKLETARRGFEAFNRTFAEGAPDLFEQLDSEVEWVPMSALLMRTSYHGHGGVRQWIEEMKRDWATFEVKPERFVDAGGDRVLVLGSWHAEGRGGRVPLDFPQAAWLVEYRKGKLLRLQTFTDRREAREAAGVPE